MRINPERFKEGTCKKCKHYAGDKPTLGKCLSTESAMIACAKMRTFHVKEFEEITGISLDKENEK